MGQLVRQTSALERERSTHHLVNCEADEKEADFNNVLVYNICPR